MEEVFPRYEPAAKGALFCTLCKFTEVNLRRQQQQLDSSSQHSSCVLPACVLRVVPCWHGRVAWRVNSCSLRAHACAAGADAVQHRDEGTRVSYGGSIPYPSRTR